MTCTGDGVDIVQPKREHPINLLLAALPESEFERIQSDLEPVSLPRGQVLFEPGEKITHVYFPAKAMISLVSLLQNGATNEIGIVGREGMVGLPLVWGGEYSDYQAIVQIPDGGYRLDADILKAEFCRYERLHDLLLLYTQALFTQVSQTAVANAQCRIESRLAQWLLIVQDSIESDQLPLTQEFVAEMLGTRRPSVTVAASALQKDGIIKYTRGKITILSREKLEDRACECYHHIRREFARLLNLRYGTPSGVST